MKRMYLTGNTEKERRKDLKSHIRVSRRFLQAKNLIQQLIDIQYLSKKDRRIISRILDRLISVQSLLDDYYHNIITEREFLRYGHIYYRKPNQQEVIHGRKS